MAENNNSSVAVPQLEQSPPLLVKKLSNKARLPTRGSAFAAGYDMYSAQAATVPARGKVLVDTDIAIAVPANTCTSSLFIPSFNGFHIPRGNLSIFAAPLPSPISTITVGRAGFFIPTNGASILTQEIKTDGRIAPRSGLASKHSIQTGAGVIDADYRGQVKILLFNHSDVDYNIVEGDRIAQLVIERIYTPEVAEVAELEESVRGAGGFGSTGTN
jgi:dUTP pyrophosphatase